MNDTPSQLPCMRPLAVIFDLDGTLVDSAAAIAKIGNKVLAEQGLPLLTEEEARGYVGNGAAKFIERALAARGVTPEGAALEAHVERFEAFYADAPGEDNVPYPGVDALVRELHADGVKLGVCTNKPGAPTRTVIEAMGWIDLFGALVGGDALPTRKPDPAPLHHCAALLEVDFADGAAVYVGDSEVDAATAKAAGAPFAIFTEGYRKTPIAELPHDRSFSDYAQLGAILREMTGAA